MKKLEGFTPGPFMLKPRSVFVEDAEGGLIADCSRYRRDGELVPHTEQEANARLFAQAPTLLEQRDKLVEVLQEAMDILHGGVRDRAERVLREVGE